MWGMAVAVALISIEVVKSFFHDHLRQDPARRNDPRGGRHRRPRAAGAVGDGDVTYAIAIVRMSPLGTLVQRLNAIESMSHVDVLCLDKTGTITTNQLKVEELHPIDIDEAELRRRLGTYCASATVSNRTNDAITNAVGGTAAPVADEVQFDSVRKWGSLDIRGRRDARSLRARRPEILLARVPSFEAKDLLRSWSEQGLRVLMFATQSNAGDTPQKDGDPQLPRELRRLGS